MPRTADAERSALSDDELRTTFQTTFSDGALYAVDGPVPEFFDALTSKDRRAIMSDAIAFARDFRPSRNRLRFDVTALCRAGALQWIFVIDRRVDRALRSRWRALIKDANVRASLQR